MARTRSLEVQKRNDAIFAQWQRGESLTSLAATYGISRQVVGRVVASYHPEGAEDEDRALYRGYMWRLYDEVQVIGDQPGYKMRPDGRPAEDLEGNPALDTNVQVQAKELQLKILRELRLLDARDKQQAKQVQVTHEVASQLASEDIARRRAEMELKAAERQELEELRRTARLIQGTAEAVRELPRPD